MKKILSLLLMIAMVVSLLPVSFASDTDSEAIKFEFTTTAKKLTAEISGASIVNLKDMADGYSSWYVEGLSWVYKPALKSTNLQWYALEDNLKDSDGAYVNSVAAALVLNIEKTGTFVPTITYYKHYCSPKTNIYLIKKNESDSTYQKSYAAENTNLANYIAENCNTENCLGTIEGYSSDKTEVSESLRTVNITEAGEYYLIFEDAGRNENFTAYTTKNGDAVYTYVISLALTPKTEDEDIIKAFALDSSKSSAHSASISALYAATDGGTISATVGATDEDEDGIYTVTAEETDESGEYTFLYWIKGMTEDTANKLVSLSASFEYKPQNEANYLIAVYEKKGSEVAEARAEFYNGNGQLLYSTADNTVAVNEDTITIPKLPSMAGYPTATHWQLYGDASATTYGTDGNTEVALSGNMIFVAQYDDVYVNVNGKEVIYGDSLTFEADSSEGEFMWWQRTSGGVTEIVSTDKTYTFCPWEDCEVSAVYGDTKQIMAGSLRRIILDNMGSNSFMAEFVGLDGTEVVEKGIILGGKKIAMSSNNTQFTVTNNISATEACGYAIIKDGDAYTEITDGTVTVSE